MKPLLTTMSLTLVLASSLLAGCATARLPALPGLPTTSADGRFGVDPNDLSIPRRMIDKGIERTAKINIYNVYPMLRGKSRIAVDSFDGNVLLTGEVPSEADRIRVQTLVSSISDVRSLYNELKISRKHTMSYNALDAYITSQLKGKIIASPRLKASHLKIVSELGVVYIMGRGTQAEKQEIIRLANSTPSVLQLVFLTEYY